MRNVGYTNINPIGSVIGADKVRKATPDTFIKQSNGRYVFFEHTTQKDNVYGKIDGDLDKCFDKKKTGISPEDIQEVVICHTSNLYPDEVNTLAEKCRMKCINLNIYGNGTISFDLFNEFPDLAREFLGIEIDTGQIITSEKFVANNIKLATRLNTAFHFHAEEIKLILDGLENEDLAIISGRPGIGKTRLALECCNQFKKLHPEYDVWCISNKGLDLVNDLHAYFSEKGQFLILVDDANRISQFEHIMHLLREQREDQQIKVISTVRDYALTKIHKLSEQNSGRIEVELMQLEDKQIKQL
jgi:hypothetical protein